MQMVVLVEFLIAIPYDIQFILDLGKGKNILPTSSLHYFFYYSLEKQSLEKWNQVYVSSRKSSIYCSDFASSVNIPPIRFQRWWGFMAETEVTFSYTTAQLHRVSAGASGLREVIILNGVLIFINVYMCKRSDCPLCAGYLFTCLYHKLIYFHMINSLWLRIFYDIPKKLFHLKER